MRGQIDIFEGIWGDEPVHASTVSQENDSRPNRNEVPLEGQKSRAETVDFVGKREPRIENAVEISEVDRGDGSGGAEMDEGEGRTI